jgi:hypothetical protein
LTLSLVLVTLVSMLPACSSPPAAQATQKSTTGSAENSRVALRMSPAQLKADGVNVVRQAMLVGRVVREMLDDARKRADIIRTTCLDDKLTQVDVGLRMAESRLQALHGALDDERRLHEHAVLSVIGQRLDGLGRDAQRCVGHALYDTGATRVVSEVDRAALPDEQEPSRPPDIAPPPVAPSPPVAAYR